VRISALALLLSACIPDNGPLMRPGEDCMACHGGTGSLPQAERTRHAKTWTVAGTVFEASDTAAGVEGAEIEIVDADGFSFALRSNLAGNFYSRESVRLPLKACIARGGATICQQSEVTSGACNSCHGLAQLGAPQPPLIVAP
jgi:hypothetical protein